MAVNTNALPILLCYSDWTGQCWKYLHILNKDACFHPKLSILDRYFNHLVLEYSKCLRQKVLDDFATSFSEWILLKLQFSGKDFEQDPHSAMKTSPVIEKD